MLQLQLQIQHAALIAPRLDLLDAIAICFGDTEFDETKCVLGKTRVAQAKPVAAFGCEVRENLSIQKIEERGFRISISRCDHFCCWRRRDRFWWRGCRSDCGRWCNRFRRNFRRRDAGDCFSSRRDRRAFWYPRGWRA